MDRHENTRVIRLSALTALLLLGAVLGSSITPKPLTAKTACPQSICNGEGHNCFNTDVNWSCTPGGLFSPCTSVHC
jgi:hypothetical protein